MFQHIGHNDKPGEEAHDYGIPEYGSHGDVSLPGRAFGTGGSGGDGGSADACFIGEQAAGNAVAGRVLHGVAGDASENGIGHQRMFQNQPESGENGILMDIQQYKTAADIEKPQGRDNFHAQPSDGLDPS